MAVKSPQQVWLACQNMFGRLSCLQPKFSITDIPLEVLDCIFKVLPVPDQVCFALSCKYLYAYFCKLQTAQYLSLPQLSREVRPILCRNIDIESHARTQVLRRLEDAKWKYCVVCWNLHPHSAWGPPKRQRCLECQQLNGQPRCIPGIVDICPCLSITKSDQRDLIKTIRSVGYQPCNGRKEYYNGLFYHANGGRKNQTIWHDCTLTEHPYAKVEVETALSIDEDGQTLRVQNVYKFHSLTQASPGICPHKHPRKWLDRFFQDAGSSFAGWHRFNIFSPSCWVKAEPVEETGSLEVCVIRLLGKAGWPDRLWNRNSHS